MAELSRTEELNNPGALRPGPDTDFEGRTGVSDDKFLTFRTPELGARAFARDTSTKVERGLNTIEKLVSARTPRGADKNETDRQIAVVAQRLNIDKDAVLDFNDPAVVNGVLTEIAAVEAGKRDAFDLNLISRGIELNPDRFDTSSDVPGEDNPPLLEPTFGEKAVAALVPTFGTEEETVLPTDQLEEPPSATSSFMAGVGAYDALVGQGRAKRNSDLNAEIIPAILDDSVAPKDRAKKAQELTKKAAKPMSIGEAYVSTKIGSVLTEAGAAAADEFDIAVNAEESRNAQVQIITGENITFNNFLNRPDVVAASIGDFFRQVLSPENLKADTQIGKIITGSEILTRMIEEGNALTYKEILTFIDPIPYENSIDVDFGVFMADVMEGDNPFSNPQFTEAMVSKYGPLWKLRFTAFAVKEVGVDLGILFLAASQPAIGALMFPKIGEKVTKFASLAVRFRAVLLRALAVGTGGGAVASGINLALGREADFAREFGIRTVGELGGEALVKTIVLGLRAGKGILKGISSGTVKMAEAAGLKVHTREVARMASLESLQKSSLGAAIIKASIALDTREFKKFATLVGEAIDNPQNLELRKSVSELIGIDEASMDILLPLADQIFKAELKNIRTIEEAVITQTLARAQAALAKLEKTVPKLKTDKARLKGEARLEKARQIVKELGDKASATSKLTTGSFMADLVLQSKAVGFRIIGEQTAKQRGVFNEFLTVINANEYTSRPEVIVEDISQSLAEKALKFLNPFTYTKQMKKVLLLTEPDNYAFGQAAKDAFDAINARNKIAKSFQRMMDLSIRGLNNKSQTKVFKIIQEGAEKERFYGPDELLGFGLNSAEQDSYYAMRKTLDMAHFTMDNSLVKELRSKGVMAFRDGAVNVIRKPTKGKLTKEQIKDGFVYVEEVNATASRKPFKGPVKESELSTLQSVLPAHEGYIPIIYKNARYQVSIANLKTGTVSRRIVSPRMSDAKKAAETLQRQAGKNEAVIFSTFDDIGGTSQVGFFNKSFQLFDILDESSAKAIQKNLGDDVDADIIRIVLRELDLQNLKKRFVGSRAPGSSLADPALKLPSGARALLLPAREAIAEYLQSAANRAGMADWRAFAIKNFQREYKHLINKGVPWHDPKAVPSLSESLGSLKAAGEARQARQHQKWLLRIISGKTTPEKMVENFLQGKIFQLLDSPSVAARTAGMLMDRMVLPKILTTGLNATRGLVSISKLGLFSTAQILVQGSQAAMTIGSRPIDATLGMKDLFFAAVGHLARKTNPKIKLGKETEQLLQDIRQSGYVADLDTSDFMTMLRSPQQPITKALHRINQIGFVPFRTGEGMNRLIAFAANRRAMTREAINGTLLGLDGKPFKGTVSDAEFLRLVTNKAKITALNMGKAGQLESLSGIGSVIFQFKQVLPKAMHVFETSELTARQKFGAGAAMIALWGPTAIPFLPDLVAFGDWTVRYFSDTPTTRDGDKITDNVQYFTSIARDATKTMVDYLSDITPEELQRRGLNAKSYDRLFRKGLINAATDGEVDVVNRIGLGRFIQDQFETAQNWGDLIVGISVVMDIADAAEKTGVTRLINPFTWMELISGKRTAAELFGRPIDGSVPENIGFAMKEFGQAFAYLGSIARFTTNVNQTVLGVDLNKQQFSPFFDPRSTNFFTTTTGNVTGIAVTKGRLFQLLFGLTPGPLVDEFDFRNLQKLYLDKADEFRKEQNSKFLSAPSNSKRLQIIAETAEQLGGMKSLLQAQGIKDPFPNDFINSVSQSFLNLLLNQQTPKSVRTPDLGR